MSPLAAFAQNLLRAYFRAHLGHDDYPVSQSQIESMEEAVSEVFGQSYADWCLRKEGA